MHQKMQYRRIQFAHRAYPGDGFQGLFQEGKIHIAVNQGLAQLRDITE